MNASNFIDITGQKFEHCTAIKREKEKEKGKHSRAVFLFRCECGKEFYATSNDVRKGRIKSCGCVNRKEIKEKVTKHGYYKHPIYSALSHMKQRCYNPKCKEYDHYGGRGIGVCEEWRNNPVAFIEWSLANGWEKGLTIDRKNNNKDYTPDNCRWTTWKVNESNTRRNVYVEYKGENMTMAEFSRRIGQTNAFVRFRLKQGMTTNEISKYNTGEWEDIKKKYDGRRNET